MNEQDIREIVRDEMSKGASISRRQALTGGAGLMGLMGLSGSATGQQQDLIVPGTAVSNQLEVNSIDKGTDNIVLDTDETQQSPGFRTQIKVHREAVGTTATPIMTLPGAKFSGTAVSGGMIIVTGQQDTQSDSFSEWVQVSSNDTVVVRHSRSSNVPAGRTYNRNGLDIELSMAADTYRVTAMGIFTGGEN